jgi:diguanylate cyclase (GGDEF)-like protein
LAQHDALTGLANRHRLLSFSRRVLALRSPLWSNSSSSLLSANNALMSSEPIAVLSIDLDGFKEINDRYGHAMGDQVLVVVARRLSHVVRSRDLVARIGGDEFIVFLDQVRHRGDAAAIVEKIGDLICAPIEINDIQVQVGASIGVALGPEDGSDLDSLLAHADRLMYATKQALRGRSARHSPTALRVKANG